MGNSLEHPKQNNKKNSANSSTKTQVIIKSHTWSRDSHGLFDYEAKNMHKKTIKTQKSGILTRKGDDIGLSNYMNAKNNVDDGELVKIVAKEGEYYLAPCLDKEIKIDKEIFNAENNSECLDNGIWLAVKSIKHNSMKGHEIKQGDLLKLGRIKFRVKEMSANSDHSPVKHMKTDVENEHSFDRSIENNDLAISKVPSTSATTCRICLSENSDSDNPFFSPCHCSGTMKSIHIKCLQRWLKSKLHIKESGEAVSIYWKALECELCKTAYPQVFEVENKRYDIIEVDRPNCPYIMLEVLSKDKNMARAVHVIKLENKSIIKLGRGHDSDIRITDISVSRTHAMIKLDKEKFYLEDNSSKFGTLLNIREPVKISGMYSNMSVQLGRTLVHLSVKKNKSLFPVCFSVSKTVDSSAEEDNEDIVGRNAVRGSENLDSDRNGNIDLDNGSIHEDNSDNEGGQRENLEEPNYQQEARIQRSFELA